MLSGLSVAAFAIDVAASNWFREQRLPGDIAKAIDLSEVFAHGSGAFAILLVVWVVAVERRTVVWLAVLTTLSSGLAANGLKALFVRVRPHAVQIATFSDSSSVLHLPEFMAVANKLSAPEASDGMARAWDSRQRSFPSGHAATAGGLAIGLSLAFVRGTWIFAMLALVAGVQRLTSGAHYPSDILAGLAVACVCSGSLLWLAARFRPGRSLEDQNQETTQ